MQLWLSLLFVHSLFCHFSLKLSFSEERGQSFKYAQKVYHPLLLTPMENTRLTNKQLYGTLTHPYTLCFFFTQPKELVLYKRGGGRGNLTKIILDFTAHSKLTDTVKYSAIQGTICEKAYSNRLVTLFSLILVHCCVLQLYIMTS